MLTIEGNIVNIDKTSRGRIEIGGDGLILSVGKETGSADIVLKDELIFPGFIDLHVHARECADHTQDYKEDFLTAGQAAINGGVVAFAEMPNNPTPPITDESYNEKKALSEKSIAEVILYAGTTPTTKPLSFKVPYKIYISKSVGDLFFDSFKELDSFLVEYEERNISFHCEDPKILKSSIEQPTHEKRRPPEAEISAVDFALQTIEKHNLIGRICHCSTMEAMEKIVEAKKRGVKVTAEVTPHHLYFDEESQSSAPIHRPISGQPINGHATHLSRMLQINPPIRQTKKNRLALIAALKKGDLDYLGTDHSPHTIEEKEKGISGMPHLDTYGPFTTWLIKEHGFTPEDIARVCSYNPGNFINSFTDKKYGKIEQGFIGSLTVIDIEHPITIEKSMLKTKAGWSPFEGVEFPGRVAYTIIKGKIYKA